MGSFFTVLITAMVQAMQIQAGGVSFNLFPLFVALIIALPAVRLYGPFTGMFMFAIVAFLSTFIVTMVESYSTAFPTMVIVLILVFAIGLVLMSRVSRAGMGGV